MSIDINTIINMILTAVVGYISWTFRDRDAKKEARIQCVEQECRRLDDKVARNNTKYYQDFVTRDQHDMDVNAILKKLDEVNVGITKINRDIGVLIGRGERSNG